jgi:hypothetical protein
MKLVCIVLGVYGGEGKGQKGIFNAENTEKNGRLRLKEKEKAKDKDNRTRLPAGRQG